MEQQKRCVVTGAAGGIGKWIALGLAQAGYHVGIVVRDAARGAVAKSWILDRAPDAKVDVLLADLASLKATAAAGRQITARYGQVDVLVLNAGVLLSRREVSAEGHDKVLAVNHLSGFVLIRELTGALQAAASARIVAIGSSRSDSAKIDPLNLELTKGWGVARAYGQSKLASMMTTFTWANRLQGVAANVVHPGLVASGLVRSRDIPGLVWRMLQPFSRTEQQGAETPLFVAMAPEHAATTGKYFKDRRIVAPNPLTRDAALCRQVWDATERLIGY